MRLKYIFDATKRQKETITNWATKAGKNPEDVIAWAEGNFEKDADQLAASKWFIAGHDTDTFRQALYICNQKKLDPLKQNPEQLVSSNPDLKPKEKAINPDDVLTDRKEDGEGNVTYAARDEDREVIRQIINTHFGIEANPWCLMQSEGGELNVESADYWEHYDAYPKRIAFRNGKLLAFSAGTNPDVREWWDRSDRSFPFVPYNGKSWIGQSGETYEISGSEVFKSRGNRRERLSNHYSEDIESSASAVSVEGNELWLGSRFFEISNEDDKYYYVDTPRKAKFQVSKDMLQLEGECLFCGMDGEPRRKATYLHGEKNGIEEFYKNGRLESRAHYKNDEKDGVYEYYGANGAVMEHTEYKRGLKNGVCIRYEAPDVPASKFHYVDDKLDGICITYYEDGSIRTKETFKDDHKEGPFEEYYDNGNMRRKSSYNRDGLYVGHYESYYQNGQLDTVCTYDDMERMVGECRTYYSNGQLRSSAYYNEDGDKVGERVTYYENGQIDLKYTLDDNGLRDGVYESHTEDGHILRKMNFKHGKRDGLLEEYDYNTHKLIRREMYKDDKWDGLYEEYDKDTHNLIRREMYKDNKCMSYQWFDKDTGELVNEG